MDWASRVGQRVVVRYRPDGGGLTDVVGELLAVTGQGRSGTDDQEPGTLVVLGRKGRVAVPLSAVLAGKVVPPRPTRPGPGHLALSLGDLERVSAQHWVAPDHEPLGDWLLRAAGGFTGRANSVLVHGDPGRPLADALAAVQSWYAARGLPALASLAVPADPPFPVTGRSRGGPVDGAAQLALHAAIDQLGWGPAAAGSAYTLTAATADLVRRSHPGVPAGLTLDWAPAPDDGWLATYRYRGGQLPDDAMTLLLSAPEQVFGSVRTSGTTVAVARGSLASGWAAVTAVDVDPAFRRLGLARLLLAELAGWARQRGAASILLQTAASNAAAQRLYLSAGFTVHHRYDYLTPAQPPG